MSRVFTRFAATIARRAASTATWRHRCLLYVARALADIAPDSLLKPLPVRMGELSERVWRFWFGGASVGELLHTRWFPAEGRKGQQAVADAEVDAQFADTLRAALAGLFLLLVSGVDAA